MKNTLHCLIFTNMAKLFDRKTARKFGRDYTKVLTKELLKAGKKGSGKLIRSLDTKVQQQANNIVIVLQSEEYLEYVDKGRKPGKYPPVKAIADWAKLKGISPKAVFPISRKIFKFGIKPTNVIDKSIKKITSPRYLKTLEMEVVENVENIITEQLENNK